MRVKIAYLPPHIPFCTGTHITALDVWDDFIVCGGGPNLALWYLQVCCPEDFFNLVIFYNSQVSTGVAELS